MLFNSAMLCYTDRKGSREGMGMYRILIVEDDALICDALLRHLGAWGFEARAVSDFLHVTEAFTAFDAQLVLMDLSLPFQSGYAWCQELRRLSKAPIVFISSAADNMSIVTAMTLGADDFIAKPFDATVLHAKLLALLRRAYDFAGDVRALSCRGAQLSSTDASLEYRGQRLSLTRNEYRILLTLMEHKGQIVSRELLMQRLWETDSFVDENTLSVNVNRLRKRLAAIGLDDLIVTRKGMGYIVAEI